MTTAVIFDLDDTLISEKAFVNSGYHAVGRHLAAFSDMTEEKIYLELQHLFYQDPKMVFNRWFEQHHIAYENSQIKMLIDLYRDHFPDIAFYEDVLPVLEFLKTNNINTGIISDGYLSTQQNKLQAIHAADYFDRIIMTETYGRDYWKPHPRAFEEMKSFFHTDFSNIIFVGDNPHKDFYIKKTYPITTVRIMREGSIYEKAEYLGGIREDIRIKSLAELKEII